ncbi:uncharacterized protein LOC107778573 [Nicotiana tabacum]|uniref:Uncharacterized protein LOC107778573 n=1 Tax=Nicotiana tabacum TaxID=4097 RepID=A0AC58TG66_TOBAC
MELATYKLEDMANTWYETVLLGRPAGAPPLTWDEFTKLFKNHFLPDSLMQKYARDFERLVQTLDMDVSTYNTKFCKLDIYAFYLVPTEEARVQRFVDGLVGRLYTVVAPQMKTLSYSDVVNLARKIENKGRDERAASELRKKAKTRGAFNGGFSENRRARNQGQQQQQQQVATLVGESLLAEYVYRACQIRVEGRDTLADLIKGCLGLLAIVNDTRNETVSIENVPVVREFSDVFPEDLPGLPPNSSATDQVNTEKYKVSVEEECEQSFQKLKMCLTTAPILALPSGSGGFSVFCDASRVGLGCVLMQNGRVIAYASRQLKNHEQNYHTHHLEMVAVQRDLNLQQRRWMELLKDYDCSISYHPRKANVVADALSRKSIGSLAKSLLVERIKATQYEDERLCKYRNEALAGKSKDMIIESDGVLRMGDTLCVADVDELRHAILKEAYNTKYTTHPGSTKIYHDLKQFYWLEVQEAMKKVRLIRQRLLAAQSRQKSYADKRRRDLVFTIGDKVFLRVSPMKGVMRFGKRGKLSPRFIGPYKILDQVGAVAYRLALPPKLTFIHPVFHVSILRKCILDSSQVIEAPAIPLDEKLSYEEKPMAIVDRQVRKLRSKEIEFVKVLLRNHTVEEATWELEKDMQAEYPHLFQSTGCLVVDLRQGKYWDSPKIGKTLSDFLKNTDEFILEELVESREYA